MVDSVGAVNNARVSSIMHYERIFFFFLPKFQNDVSKYTSQTNILVSEKNCKTNVKNRFISSEVNTEFTKENYFELDHNSTA